MIWVRAFAGDERVAAKKKARRIAPAGQLMVA
jgi:hypothetical protein